MILEITEVSKAKVLHATLRKAGQIFPESIKSIVYPVLCGPAMQMFSGPETQKAPIILTKTTGETME